MGLPLIVGEFGIMHGGDSITEQTAIPYLTIIEQCHLNEIGWLAWSWGPRNALIYWDMTKDGTFETLNGWGIEVAITNKYSIKNTSVRPYFIVNKECKSASE